MAWTAPSDHAASVVSVAEWNNFHGASGNCAYLKSVADAPVKAQGDGGTVLGGRAKLNFVSGANVVATVADDSGNDRINVTLAASGGSTPDEAAASGTLAVVTAASQGNKGAYTQAFASTGFAVTKIILYFEWNAYTSRTWFLDIATGGAGSESVVIPNLCHKNYAASVGSNDIYHLDFAIPASTRIAVRGSNESGNDQDTFYVAMNIFG